MFWRLGTRRDLQRSWTCTAHRTVRCMLLKGPSVGRAVRWTLPSPPPPPPLRLQRAQCEPQCKCCRVWPGVENGSPVLRTPEFHFGGKQGFAEEGRHKILFKFAWEIGKKQQVAQNIVLNQFDFCHCTRAKQCSGSVTAPGANSKTWKVFGGEPQRWWCGPGFQVQVPV